jgi:hypothetical protein
MSRGTGRQKSAIGFQVLHNHPKATGFFEGDKFPGWWLSIFGRSRTHDFQIQNSPGSGS